MKISPPSGPGPSDEAADPMLAEPTHRRYGVMGFLCVLSFLTYFDRVCIGRAQKDIMISLDISREQMGLIFGAFWLAYALFEIPGGWMGDRYGSRITLTRIVLAWSLFTVLSGSAWGFVSLLTFRFLFGAGEAGAYPNMARVQASWLPVRSRARAGGLLWLLARFGGAFSPLLFGLMLTGFGSVVFRELLMSVGLPGDVPAWRVAFWAAGLVGAVWCVSFYWWFRDDPAEVPAVNAAELRLIKGHSPGRPTPTDHSVPGYVWKDLLTSRSMWAMGGLYVLYSFGWSFFVSWLPLYLEEVHKTSFEDSEIMTGLPLFCGGIACLVGGVLSDFAVRRLGRKWLGRAIFPACGFAMSAVAMFCLQFAQTAEQATVLMCLAAIGGDFGQGANWATVVDMGGRYAGTAMGFINMVGNAGNYLQPVIGAIIFGSLGWNFLMGAYATTYFLAAGMWLFINPDRTFYKDPQPRPTVGIAPGDVGGEEHVKEMSPGHIKPR